jgi:hypothetical protein
VVEEKEQNTKASETDTLNNTSPVSQSEASGLPEEASCDNRNVGVEIGELNEELNMVNTSPVPSSEESRDPHRGEEKDTLDQTKETNPEGDGHSNRDIGVEIEDTRKEEASKESITANTSPVSQSEASGNPEEKDTLDQTKETNPEGDGHSNRDVGVEIEDTRKEEANKESITANTSPALQSEESDKILTRGSHRSTPRESRESCVSLLSGSRSCVGVYVKKMEKKAIARRRERKQQQTRYNVTLLVNVRRMNTLVCATVD